MKKPSLRALVSLAAATGLLLPILLPAHAAHAAHAAQPALMSNGKRNLSFKNEEIGNIFSNMALANLGSTERNGDCKESFDLDLGDFVTFVAINQGSKRSCKYTFKSPTGTVLAITCPYFNLDPAGCNTEKLVLKAKGMKAISFCDDVGPNGVLPGNNGVLIYKKKASTSNECSGGLVCLIGVVEE